VIRFLADENLNNDILRALRRRIANVDVLRVQDVGLIGAEDEAVLEWAAREKRVVLTHDVATLIGFAWARTHRGERHTGVIAIPQSLGMHEIIDDLILIAECSLEEEWEDLVRFLPLR
jgi:hypothetical protein